MVRERNDWQFISKEKRNEFFNVFVNSPNDEYSVICRASAQNKSQLLAAFKACNMRCATTASSFTNV